MRRCLLAFVCLLPLLAVAQDDLGQELVTNGDFELDADRNGLPDGFGGDTRTTKLVEDDGNHFVRITVPGPDNGSGGISRTLKLDPDWFKLRLSVKVRYQDIKQGTESWYNGRLAMSFHNAEGKQVGGWPNVFGWTGTSQAWVAATRDYIIPDGAVELRFSCSLFTTTGQMDYDDVSFTVLSRRPKPEDATLPDGVTAEWRLAKAYREENANRGRVCLNGLWQIFPLMPETPQHDATEPPAKGTGWGYFKVPAAWPGKGVTGVNPIGPDIWDLNLKWDNVDAAWYQRTFEVPAEWQGRRRYVTFDYPQTVAEVWVDGQSAGSVRWPAGRLDVTDLTQPGKTATLLVRLTTEPFAKEQMVAMREDLIEQVKAAVKYRGLVGDVFLTSEPAGPKLGSVQVRPSVKQHELGLAVRPEGLAAGQRYTLSATASRGGKQEWQGRSQPFTAADVKDGIYVAALNWPNPALWDFEHPNLYDLTVSLEPAGANPLDTVPLRTGFREISLDGRNLLLNGLPLHLRALNFSNTTRSNELCDADTVRGTLERMRSLGFNFIILSNYGLDPGSTLAFGDLLRVADEMGFGLSFSAPHAFRSLAGGRALDGDWKSVASYAVETAGNHPAVLAYAMDHNYMGYKGDQNPDKIDGIYRYLPDPETQAAAAKSAAGKMERAMEAEGFLRGLDPSRECYHHQSGHCGAWHTVNIYLCWAPIQERSEWLRHWATEGVKPLFFVEWGLPHQASWGGHRQGPFIWRNKVNSEPLGVEFGAMLTGANAYELTPTIRDYVDNYERVYAKREPFHISSVFWKFWNADNELDNTELQSLYAKTNWPRLRTWGITALLPWDQGRVAYRTNRVADRARPTNWANLQQPGYAPDLLPDDDEYFRGTASEFKLTSLGEVFQRWNQPVVGYLGGAPENFCEVSHNVVAGQQVTKQAILINDRLEPVNATFRWRLGYGRAPVGSGEGTISAPAGGRAMVPFSFQVPPKAEGGDLRLTLWVKIDRQEQEDDLTFHVVSPAPRQTGGKLALFDPAGKTLAELQRLGLQATPVQASADLSSYESLLIGREAIGLDNRLPDYASILARGGRVLVMEQTEPVLSRRLGFRTNNPSLRNVFVRLPEDPILAGLDDARLRDWCGAATLEPGKLDLPEVETTDPLRDWLGFSNTRVWKAGNTGQVATVVIEKPHRGKFVSLLDGGFDLEYSPLLMLTEGSGELVFCQMDVTGRTAPDPAADRLQRNLLHWLGNPGPRSAGQVARYVGGPEGATLLSQMGVRFQQVPAAQAPGDGLLLVGPDAGAGMGAQAKAIANAVAGGANVFCLPQSEQALAGWLPFEVKTNREARYDASLAGFPGPFGVGPSELHWRGKKEVLAVGSATQEPTVFARLAHGRGAYYFCQVTPDDWDYHDEYRVYLKRTADRTATLWDLLLSEAGAAWELPLADYWSSPAPEPLELSGRWSGLKDQAGKLTIENLPTAGWKPLNQPGSWEDQWTDSANYDGVVWLRTEFDWPGATDGTVELRVGKVDDEDWTYLNGQLVGHIGQDTNPQNYWEAPRVYRLPAGVLKSGRNSLVVKVRDLRQAGGIMTGPLDLRRPDRWLESYYLDTPAKLDDPYRYNRW